ncbi:MAG TPA: hypothetical protein VEC56_12575, partial [Candidatus Krumholzibacteria bacterium]|nr:hypothetical protein [Candidatus Krumholzibacteria bacterium]
MKICVGIDLGSTTTKAVILGDAGETLGRGITNSRSNYKVACDVALGEAWRVRPEGPLIERLGAWLAPENVQVVYGVYG